MKTLTERQSEIVRHVCQCLQHTRFLTVSDLVQKMGLAGESSLMPTLQSIERKGYLVVHRWGKGQNRFIELTEQGIAEAQGIDKWPGLPVLGSIPAGPLEEAVQDAIDFVNPGNALRWKMGDYFLEVKGTSMWERISDGDRVLLRPNEDAYSGQIAATLIWTPERDKCESTLKYVHFQPGQPVVTLKAHNSKVKPMEVPAELVTFAGVYHGLFRPE